MMMTNALNVLKWDNIACFIQFWNRLSSPISIMQSFRNFTPSIHHGGAWNIFGANLEKHKISHKLSRLYNYETFLGQ